MDYRRKAKVAGLESRGRAASGRILSSGTTFCVAYRSSSIRRNSRGITTASFGPFLLLARELCFVTKFHRRPRIPSDIRTKQDYSLIVQNSSINIQSTDASAIYDLLILCIKWCDKRCYVCFT